MRSKKFSLGYSVGISCIVILLSAMMLEAVNQVIGGCGWQHGGVLCAEGFCCSTSGYCGQSNLYCDPQNCQSQCRESPPPSPPSPSPPPSPPPPPPAPPCVNDISSIISKEVFEEMIPFALNDSRCYGSLVYTYEAFIGAARTFCEFGTTGSEEIRKREVAAFFGQTSHETTGGWATAPGGPVLWGYCFLREIGGGDYCEYSREWPCVPGQQYFGRGPIQLSYNYNYGQAGKALGVDLLSNPDLVATDPVLSFKTALWFWMTPQSPKPSCHDVMIGKWTPSPADVAANRLPGFGMVTNIINGGRECGNGPNIQANNRVKFYDRYCTMLGTTKGENVDCGNQRSFGVTLNKPYPKSLKSAY